MLCALVAAGCSATARERVRTPEPKPAYRWRGVSLDLARRYYEPSTIRRFIALAAHYRLSVVHLHLTDNEAWRLPSRAYPRLPSPLHYTQAQIRELVSYARGNGITLVPEIDLPAHAAAAIRAYPDLACGSNDTLCPRTAAQFARTEIAEAMRLFPDAYVHTGGDEVQGWTANERAAFEASLDTFIRRNHRTMVVWDDESDAAPPDAIVEVWHLGDAAHAAMQRGHRVIMASDGPLYFDAVQGAPAQEPRGSPYMSTLEEVYSFSPPARAFGVEAVVWSEHLANASQLWYVLLPRETAFSTVATLGAHRPAWQVFRDFILPGDFSWLAAHGYAFRIPNPIVEIDGAHATYASVPGNPNAAAAYTRERRVRVKLRSLVPGAHIFYRTANARGWTAYREPFEASSAAVQIDAKTVAPDGRQSAVTTLVLDASLQHARSLHFDDVVSP